MQMQGSFDATQFKPNQGGDRIAPGTYDFSISTTSIDPTKDNTGGMFVVDFSTPAGSIVNRYNLWNQSAKAVEIAHGQLSALCHAVGIFKIDWTNEGAALRGARGKLVIGFQKGQEPTAENPAGGYTEIKKVLDSNGNEPGKAAAPAQQQQQPQPQPFAQPQQQPLQQQQGGGWGAPQQQPQQPQQTTPNSPQPLAQAPQQGQPWQPGGATAGAAPPWGSR